MIGLVRGSFLIGFFSSEMRFDVSVICIESTQQYDDRTNLDCESKPLNCLTGKNLPSENIPCRIKKNAKSTCRNEAVSRG